jgi:hypothetical protein
MRTPNNRRSEFLDPNPPVITVTDGLLSVDEGVRPEDYCMMVETCRGYAKGFIYVFIYLLRFIVYSTNCVKNQRN